MPAHSSDLSRLRIDRSRKAGPARSKWPARVIIGGVLLFLLIAVVRTVYSRVNSGVEVQTMRVRAIQAGDAAAAGAVVLNATGYIVAAHKIQLASKVIGKVAWIGVEKGNRVRKDQVLVRLEDDEYRAQVQQARGSLLSLQARLEELQNGSRPEEIARAASELETGRADLENARVNLDRVRTLVKDGVMARQSLDDAQARYDGQSARTTALQKSYELVRIGPRQEQIAAVRGQIEQARGALAFAETQHANTVIRAPVSGTILERNVERGEFVTTGFVGDRGAKGYVVSLADLNDLQVELDINQNDFAKLDSRQKGVITTDAFPDRKYEGIIDEISPEANRQKATVQVKVKVLNPDDYLRPEMNASVAFIAKDQAPATGTQQPLIVIPASAVRDGGVFVSANGRAIRRAVKTGGSSPSGIRIQEGLNGGEDLIVNPPPDLKDGAKIKTKS
jgi:HlyD family secretion protein